MDDNQICGTRQDNVDIPDTRVPALQVCQHPKDRRFNRNRYLADSGHCKI